MRIVFNRLILPAAGALLHVSSLSAEVPQGDEPSASTAAWVAAVNAKLEEVTARSHGVIGFATATFRRANDGRVTDIEVAAATPAMRHAARNTLTRLGRLPALPQGISPRQRIKLQLLFDDGSDVPAFDKEVQALHAKAEAANTRLANAFARAGGAVAKKP